MDEGSDAYYPGQALRVSALEGTEEIIVQHGAKEVPGRTAIGSVGYEALDQMIWDACLLRYASEIGRVEHELVVILPLLVLVEPVLILIFLGLFVRLLIVHVLFLREVV